MRPASGEDGWFSLARGDLCGGCHTCWAGADEKARIERLCLSPYVETFNSKVIKGFVPELRSRYVFFEFRDSYVLSFWTFDVRFTPSHIMAMVHLFASLGGKKGYTSMNKTLYCTFAICTRLHEVQNNDKRHHMDIL